MTDPNLPSIANPKEKFKDKILFLSLSLQEQISFTKRLSLLIKAGVPLMKSLRMLRDQSTNKSAIHIYSHLTDHVANGNYLSVAMQKFPKIFGNFAINVIQIGEVSGTLQENLNYLGEELKKKQDLRRKVRSALVYPVIILVATIFLTIALTVFVFPKVLPIFVNLKFELPWMTKVLIFISDLLIHQWWLVTLVFILLVVSCILSLKIPRVRLWFDRNIFRFPAIGPLLKSYNLSNFCRCYSHWDRSLNLFFCDVAPHYLSEK
jgi:type IV pilus assembly protein PilC